MTETLLQTHDGKQGKVVVTEQGAELRTPGGDLLVKGVSLEHIKVKLEENKLAAKIDEDAKKGKVVEADKKSLLELAESGQKLIEKAAKQAKAK